ncbi:hypothetical protein [Arhodomonas sp. AD133]|uniref:hypothetical protein n=1 Tax=Arhodomonas sp. AD133 TaxID=3415009 RepID=UPI003EC09E17
MAESEHLSVPGAPAPPLPAAPVCLRCEQSPTHTGGWRIIGHRAQGIALTVEPGSRGAVLILQDDHRRLGSEAPNRAIRHVHDGLHPWLCQHCVFVLSGDESALLDDPPAGVRCLPLDSTVTAGR